MTVPEDFTFPFKDSDVRRAWLDCLEYLDDDELPAMTYREWIQVAKDSAFETLCEEGLFSEYAVEYIPWVSRLHAELAFLNRRDLAKGVQR